MASSSSIRDLYSRFDALFDEFVAPYIASLVPRNEHTEPFYYALQSFVMRRFRSGLPLVIAPHLSLSREQVLPLAAASEIMFAVAVIQDDFFDNCDVRGDSPSVHAKYGARHSLAVSDYMYGFVPRLLDELVDHLPAILVRRIVALYAEMHLEVFRSFLTEICYDWHDTLSLNTVLDLHRAKTIHGAATLQAVGLMCNEHTGDVFRAYATELGIAGQIKNDIYDITRHCARRGYSDLQNAYPSYPLAILCQRVPQAEILRYLQTGRIGDVVDLMKKLGVLNDCVGACSDRVDQAIRYINRDDVMLPSEVLEILRVWAEGNRIRQEELCHSSC